MFLSERLGGEIVNCDSIQVYRGLEIGSAKLRPEARRGIRHHLIDVIEPDAELSAGVYSRLARRALEEIRLRGKLPVVAGGAGLYLRALIDGLSPAPGRDSKLRIRLAAVSRTRPGALHRFLRMRDPAAAARIHPNDHQKLIRAIELTGGSVSQTQSKPRDPLRGFAPLKLGLNPERTQLYRKLDERSAAMFRSGLVDETRGLIQAGLSPASKALQSLGYKQAVQVLRGELSLDAAIADCRTKTRQYAKRQMTWFRSEAGVHWLCGFGSEENVQSEALAIAGDFINR